MRTLFSTTFPIHESWNGSKSTLHRFFTWVTGYEILFEESREDLIPQRTEKD